jgi:hypothetical protein
MTTKAKCFKLAKEHGIEIDYYKFRGFYSTDLSCPDGFQLEDFEGARSGLSMSGIETAKELWKEIYFDLETMIGYKPWHKVPQYPDTCEPS